MKARFVTRKQTVTDREKEIAAKKLDKLAKFFPDDTEATVTFSELKNDRRKVEVTILFRDTLYRGETDGDSYVSAIEKAVDIIEGQIRKNKTRLKKRLREGSLEELAAEPEQEHTVVKTKTFIAGTMDAEEAVMEMELSSHGFYVFRNNETDKINVVYKRSDGQYGVLIPE